MYSLSSLTICGSDAFDFLQGQLTNDLRRLESATEILAAWCNPRGRVIWLGTVKPVEDGYGLAVPADMADAIARRLTMFRFRARVDIAVVDESATADPVVLVRNGVPYIGPAQSEQFTPHMLNLDLLDAVSFDKGCYTGQEIVARTHYKGATKRRTMRFSSENPVAEGDKVQLVGRDIGEVLNVARNDLLAVVPVDKADDALTAEGNRLTHHKLPYL